jgi:hypothetical protein
MMVIRDIFFCKPGKVRPMVDKFKAMNAVSVKMGMPSGRIMTDLSAERYWTVVIEWDVKSLKDFEEMMAKSMQATELEAIMKDYHELVESGRREIYTLEA